MLLSLSKESYDYIMDSAERRIFQEKKTFLQSLPEFKNLSPQKSKLLHLCSHLLPMSCIKNRVIFRENEPNKFVYFVKSGELQILKRVQMPRLDEEMEDF